MFNHSMNFSVGEDNQTLRNTIYKFAQKEIAPLADKVDKENTFPNNMWKKLGDLGLLGITADQEWKSNDLSSSLYCDGRNK